MGKTIKRLALMAGLSIPALGLYLCSDRGYSNGRSSLTFNSPAIQEEVRSAPHTLPSEKIFDERKPENSKLENIAGMNQNLKESMDYKELLEKILIHSSVRETYTENGFKNQISYFIEAGRKLTVADLRRLLNDDKIRLTLAELFGDYGSFVSYVDSFSHVNGEENIREYLTRQGVLPKSLDGEVESLWNKSEKDLSIFRSENLPLHVLNNFEFYKSQGYIPPETSLTNFTLPFLAFLESRGEVHIRQEKKEALKNALTIYDRLAVVLNRITSEEYKKNPEQYDRMSVELNALENRVLEALTPRSEAGFYGGVANNFSSGHVANFMRIGFYAHHNFDFSKKK